MSNELVVECRGVVLDLDEVNGHSGDLADDDSTKGIGDGEVRVEQLKLDVIAGEFKDLDLRLAREPLSPIPNVVLGLQGSRVQAVVSTSVLHLYLQLTNNCIITEKLLILENFEDEEKGQRYDCR